MFRIKNQIILVFSTTLILLFLFQNCAKKKISNSGESATEIQVLQSKSLDILKNNCIECHLGENAYANTLAGTDPILEIDNANYLIQTRLIVPGEPELSPLYQKVKNGDMPPGNPLSSDEVILLKDWITQLGESPTNSTGGGIITTPLAATFSSLRVNIFLSKCFSCHINRTVKLDTYESVVGAITRNNLRTRIAGGTMPPATAPQLTAQERTFLLQWIDAGAPNN